MDKFFAHFERVATVLKWPRDVWSMTLQCVFVGKAQQAYSSLSLEDAADYEKVKQSVLRVYSLVPEAYRQKFRNYQKPESLTHVEFMREKELLFDRWLSSQNITTFEDLRDIVILEDFKNCLPKSDATFVSEHKDLTASSAAVLADDYVLAHRDASSGHVNFQQNRNRNYSLRGSPPAVAVSTPTSEHKGVTNPKDYVPVCGYCKKRGHLIPDCFLLKRKNKSNSTASSRTESGLGLCVSTLPLTSRKDESICQAFAPFIMDGFVTLLEEPNARIPIKVLRDTAASQSFILENVLPFSEKSHVGASVLVQGFDMGFVNVPLHEISLSSDLVTGTVKVGVRPSLPIANV